MEIVNNCFAPTDKRAAAASLVGSVYGGGSKTEKSAIEMTVINDRPEVFSSL
jgi:hypothetical protein